MGVRGLEWMDAGADDGSEPDDLSGPGDHVSEGQLGSGEWHIERYGLDRCRGRSAGVSLHAGLPALQSCLRPLRLLNPSTASSSAGDSGVDRLNSGCRIGYGLLDAAGSASIHRSRGSLLRVSRSANIARPGPS